MKFLICNCSGLANRSDAYLGRYAENADQPGNAAKHRQTATTQPDNKKKKMRTTGARKKGKWKIWKGCFVRGDLDTNRSDAHLGRFSALKHRQPTTLARRYS